ncbi:hypothetical protein TNCT_152891 [Trichonephila clavata]|uniref:Uncharacterized protein n=1 Tax=Trichonephila clavata TaxID=2740835 RepID=A0A8X6FWX8_TRICU|nr:hypothetical protein TNCT_152891 [Trichonephila clavata]
MLLKWNYHQRTNIANRKERKQSQECLLLSIHIINFNLPKLLESSVELLNFNQEQRIQLCMKALTYIQKPGDIDYLDEKLSKKTVANPLFCCSFPLSRKIFLLTETMLKVDFFFMYGEYIALTICSF